LRAKIASYQAGRKGLKDLSKKCPQSRQKVCASGHQQKFFTEARIEFQLPKMPTGKLRQLLFGIKLAFSPGMTSTLPSVPKPVPEYFGAYITIGI